MLSTTNPHTVNRRQNSNPDIYQFADTVISLPAQHRQHRNIASKGHRRGQSLDPRLFSQSPCLLTYQEALNSPSMTNQGQYQSQQTMRETQTLGLDRPGRDIQQEILETLTHSDHSQQAHDLYHPQPQQSLPPIYNMKNLEMVDSSKFAPFPDPSENPFNITMGNEFAEASNELEIHSESFAQDTLVSSSPRAMPNQLANLNMGDEHLRRGSVQSFHSMPPTCPSTPKRQSISKRVYYLLKKILT